MLSVQEIINSCVDDMVNLHLHMIQNENEEIKKIKVRLEEVDSKIEELLEEKNEWKELGDMFRSYDDIRNSEEIINYHNIYIAGIRDGVKLMKNIGVINGNSDVSNTYFSVD